MDFIYHKMREWNLSKGPSGEILSELQLEKSVHFFADLKDFVAKLTDMLNKKTEAFDEMMRHNMLNEFASIRVNVYKKKPVDVPHQKEQERILNYYFFDFIANAETTLIFTPGFNTFIGFFENLAESLKHCTLCYDKNMVEAIKEFIHNPRNKNANFKLGDVFTDRFEDDQWVMSAKYRALCNIQKYVNTQITGQICHLSDEYDKKLGLGDDDDKSVSSKSSIHVQRTKKGLEKLVNHYKLRNDQLEREQTRSRKEPQRPRKKN